METKLHTNKRPQTLTVPTLTKSTTHATNSSSKDTTPSTERDSSIMTTTIRGTIYILGEEHAQK